jgi:lauroyl/myristoyl acyltransferase
VVGDLARAPVQFFGRTVLLPTGPFVLALASGAPIYPLFIVRKGFRKYKVVAFAPIVVVRSADSRDHQISQAMAQWSSALEEMVRSNWSQWYAFKPLF